VLITASCLVGLFLVLRSVRQEVPRLEGPTGPLAEALGWPWERFPLVTEVERNAVHEDFKTGEPLFEHALRRLVWPGIPVSGPLRPSSPEARRSLECGIGLLRQIVAPHTAEAAEPATGADSEQNPEVERARSCLADADRAQTDQWLTLYTRALLYLSQGNTAAAARDLKEALGDVPTDRRLPADIGDRTTVYEAEIYTNYALGQTLVHGGKGEPQDRRAARLKEAIDYFRQALLVLRTLSEDRELRLGRRPLSFFALNPTGLGTAAIDNDLLAAYLASPGYHHCEDPPVQEPCSGLQQRDRNTDHCYYRDSAFCRTKGRASGSFALPFAALFRRFYSKDRTAWEEENRLWALSNAADWSAENTGTLSSDPYLLYNLASLLIQQGEFEEAAHHLDRAETVGKNNSDLPPEDSDQIFHLAIVGQVLAGRRPSVASHDASEQAKSSIRTLYERFYDQEQDPPIPEFSPGSLNVQGQALLDRWLFIHRWRAQLGKGHGDFEGFSREYDRLMGEKGISKDFFQNWHDQVLTDFGKRAFERAELYDKRGEHDNAERIRRFLSENGSFPPEVVHRARGFWGWMGRKLRLWVSGAALVLFLIGSLIFLLGLHRVYRRTFVSAHREERLADLARSR
jgi:tetratricopeptide (TPR) repeat protein